MVDVWPTPAAARDFGVASRAHYAALREAVKARGVTPEQLDRALGNGPALTALVGPDNPYHGIVFRTAGDAIMPRVASDVDCTMLRPMAGPTHEGKSQDRGSEEGEIRDAEEPVQRGDLRLHAGAGHCRRGPRGTSRRWPGRRASASPWP